MNPHHHHYQVPVHVSLLETHPVEQLKTSNTSKQQCFRSMHILLEQHYCRDVCVRYVQYRVSTTIYHLKVANYCVMHIDYIVYACTYTNVPNTKPRLHVRNRFKLKRFEAVCVAFTRTQLNRFACKQEAVCKSI